MTIDQKIITAITDQLDGAIVDVKPLHNQERSFLIEVSSDVFQDKPLLAQHQLVLAPLKDLLDSEVHAVKIKTSCSD